MYGYDADGHALDPEDPDGIDPTHPTYLADPKYRAIVNKWLGSHPREEGTSAGVPPPA